MIHREQQLVLIRETMAAFPETFGLRAYPGLVFRIDLNDSYVRDDGDMQLYTHVQRGDKWLSFAKGSPDELLREIVCL
jgi:hypothetical protein